MHRSSLSRFQRSAGFVALALQLIRTMPLNFLLIEPYASLCSRLIPIPLSLLRFLNPPIPLVTVVVRSLLGFGELGLQVGVLCAERVNHLIALVVVVVVLFHLALPFFAFLRVLLFSTFASSAWLIIITQSLPTFSAGMAPVRHSSLKWLALS